MAWTPLNDHLDPPQHRRRPTPQPRRAESFLWDMFGSVGIVGWVVYLLVAVVIILLGNLIMVVGSYDKFNPPPQDFSAESIVLRNGNDDRTQPLSCWSHRIVDLTVPADADAAVNVSVQVRNRGNVSVSPYHLRVRLTAGPDGDGEVSTLAGAVGAGDAYDLLATRQTITTRSQRFVFPAGSLQGRPMRITATVVDPDDQNAANDTFSAVFKPCS